MRLILLLCVVAGTAPLLAAAQGGMYCMTGVPCGNGCTMGDGLCINGRCFDRTGQVEWECMAPMRAPGSFAPFRLNGHDSQPSWMQPQQQQQAPAQPRQQQQQQQQQAQAQDADFNPWMQQQQMPRFAPLWQPWGFPSFWRPMTWFGSPFATPFAPMGPMFNNDCGGKGPCAKGQFCDAQGVCRADDCVSQFKYGCPDDKGELKKIACPHFSGFKECYTSTSDGFRCFKGPSGSSLACASQSSNMGGGSVWSSSSGSSFQWPAWEDDSDMDVPETPAAAGGKAPVAAAPQPAKTEPVAKPAAVPAKPAPAAAAAAKAEATPAPPAAASSSSSGQQSAFKKVATEAGPAQAASAVAAGAATPVQKQQLVAAGNRNLLAADQVGPGNMPPMARMGPMFAPDGSAIMAAGPGPSIGMMDVDPNGGGMAAGMASGDQKTVVTRRGPDGMSSFSSSVSNNGGPAVASSVATSGPTTQGPTGWDVPPSATQPGAQPVGAAQQQGTAASSRDGSRPAASTTSGPDAARPTGVKNSAGLRGGVWLAGQAVLAAGVLLLLL